MRSGSPKAPSKVGDLKLWITEGEAQYTDFTQYPADLCFVMRGDAVCRADHGG
jgi:hypothetical protein